MSSTNTIDPGKAITGRVKRIADFLCHQADLTHVLFVFHIDRFLVIHARPDLDSSLAVLHAAVFGKYESVATDAGRARKRPTSARLDKQVRACVRGLVESGVEFVLAWQIAGESPHIEIREGPLRPRLLCEVFADLERVQVQAKRERSEAGEFVLTM